MKRTTTWYSRFRPVATFAAAAVATAGLALPTAAVETAPPPDPAPVLEIRETVSDAGFVHPGVGPTADDLENARAQVRAGVEPWASHYDAMSQTKYASTTYVARNQGATDDQPKDDAYDRVSMRGLAHDDSLGALTQALMYVMTGEDVYRANALHVLRTWSSLDPEKYEYFSDAHIHTGVPLYYFVSAAEILRSVEPARDSLDGYDLRWTERDQQRAEDNLVRPTLETFLYSQNRLWNQHTYGVVGMLAAAIFLDDAGLYAERVEWFSVNSTYESEHTINGGDVNGGLSSLVRLLEADDPLNPYGEDFVELVEMGRDQAHAEGDITTLSAAARMIHGQGTRLDPVRGTVSEAPDAVSPYGFLDNRLLHGADVFAQFMMGGEPPFIDTSGGASALSQAYRGRLRDLVNDLYYQYTYVEGVDVEEEAPYVALLHEQSDGPLYRYGSRVENFWNPRGSDFTDAEYWVSFPSELATQEVRVPAPATSAEVPAARYGLPLGAGAQRITDDDGESVVRLNARRGDAAVAVRRMVWGDSMAVRVRTNARATLQVSGTADSEPFELALPDTKGEWTSVVLDLTSPAVPDGTVGDHIVFLRVEDAAKVDVAGVLGDAAGDFTPPVFADAPSLAFVAVAGEPLVRDIGVDDADSEPALTLQGAPRGATIDSDGLLRWTPRSVGTEELLVVATDGAATATLPVTVRVAADRDGAVRASLAGLEDPSAYTTESWARIVAAADAARAGIDADGIAFAGLLEDLRLAVDDLDLLDPRLEDGTLDYSGVVTSSELAPDTLRALVDGSNKSHWGDRRDESVELDLGPAYRVRADRFGFLARDTFANRAEGTNVYGSVDGATWTLLTTHPNAGDDAEIEYVDVRDEVRGERYRYLRLQIDEPGVPTDPNYPGIWSLADFRVDGERSEATLDEVLSAARDAGLSEYSRGSVVLFERELDAVTAAAQEPGADEAALVRRALAAWDLLEAPPSPGLEVEPSWVTASTASWDGSRDAAANGWAMFDGDPSTFTDTTSAEGWAQVVPDDGRAVDVESVAVVPRAGHAHRANGFQVQGSNDGGQSWETFLTLSRPADQGWTEYDLEAPVSYSALRLYSPNGYTNLAELQFRRERVDTSGLDLYLAETAELAAADWTAESWAALVDAREAGLVLRGEGAAPTQEEVDAAADGLAAATARLQAVTG